MQQYPSGGSSASARRGSPRWVNYLLIGAFGVAAFAMLLLIAASLLLPPVVQNTVERYTSETPVAITQARLPEPEKASLDDRVDAFSDAIDDGGAPEPLILSGDELNALLQDLWERENIPGAMSLRIEDGRIRSDLSIPIEQGIEIGPFTPDVAGRYLNGTVTFTIGLDGAGLTADIERFVVNDKTLPGWIVNGIENEFIEKQVLNNSELQEFTRKLARVVVSADTILLEAR